MPSTKITALPALITPSANAQNTVFVVVDLDTGTPTTKKLSLQNLDLFVDNVGYVAFAQANAAFTQANTANVTANAAFAQANGAYNAANSANTFDFTNIATSAGFYGDSISVASFNLAANGRVISASNIAITGFANSTYATSAHDKANSANVLAQQAYNAANTETIGVAAFAKANSANVLAQQAFDAANTNGATYNSSAFAQANSANVLAQAAFDKGNSANVLAQSAYNAANSANTFDYTTISTTAGVYGNSTYIPVITLAANGRVSSITNTAIIGFANATFATASFDQANGAFTKANSANVLAQNAYDYANTISISLSNAFITASRNTANIAFDHANGAFTQANTALTTAALSFNAGNTAQTTASAGFNHANAAFDKANSANVMAQSSFNAANTNANTITVSFAHANGAFDKANSANVLAQAAFDQANTSNTNAINSGTYANAAFDKANSANVIAQSSYDFANTVNTFSYSAYATANTNAVTISTVSAKTNSAYDAANTALATAAIAINYDNQANGAFDKANSANVLAQNAYDFANTVNIYSYSAYTQANTANVTAQAAFDKANSANVLAQTAFDTANTKVSKSGDTMTGDLKFNGNGGILNLPTNQIAITANVDNDVSGLIAFATGVSTVYANTDVIIQANTGGATFSQWNFTKEGTITFPDSTTQTTAFTGDAAAGNVSANAIGYMGMPQNNLTSNYVITLADQGKHLYYNVSTNNIVYIPTNANVAFPVGATIVIISQTSSSANVTITPNTGVSLFLAGNTTSAGRNVTTYGMATLVHVSANTWFVDGTGVSAL